MSNIRLIGILNYFIAMKILFDHQIFTMQAHGGISRYFSKLFEKSLTECDIECQLGFIYSKNEYIKRHFGKLSNRLAKFQFRKEKHLRKWLNKARSINSLKKDQYDIFHPTYFSPYFLKYIGSKPFVLTIHDMIPEHFKDFFPPSFQIPEQKKVLAEKAEKIIAVSENTKRDILDLLPVKEEKVSVIYHGGGISTQPYCPPQIHIPDSFILFVGARNDYKNFKRFINAVKDILTTNNDLYLICCGGGPFSNSEKKEIEVLKIENKIILLNSVKDNFLAYLYSMATAFVFPSLYEGFGIPILEAFRYQCPVLLSDIAVFREVAGDNALYFNPKSESSIKKSILEITCNDSLRKKLKKNGSNRVKNFSWQKTLSKTKELYKSVA